MARLRLGDELWSITHDGARLVLVSGGKESVRKFISADHAKVQHDKLVAEKLAAGWEPTSKAVKPIRDAGEPREPALDAAIVADPYDVTAYAVYGDWYQSRQHPRGELIALQLAVEQQGGDEPDQRKLAASATKHLARYKTELLGELARYVDTAGDSPFRWRFGFIHRLDLDEQSSDRAAEIIAAVIRHPSGRVLADVILRTYTERTVERMVAALVPAAQTLRSLTVMTTSRFDQIEPITRLDRLRELTLKSYADEPATSAALSTVTRVPATLERLHLRLRAGEQPWRDLAPLFERTDLALRRIAVRSSSLGDAALAALAAGPLAPTIEVLDIALCELDAGMQAFLANRARFAALRSIYVTFDEIVPKALTALRATVARVTDVRRDPDANLFARDDDEYFDEVVE